MPTNLVRGKHVLVRADPAGDSRVLTDGAVVQRDGVILEAGPYRELRERYPEAEVLGDGRGFLLPGLVNAHHHGRGISGLQMGQPDGPLETWIHRGWGRRPLDPYLMALYTLLQMVRSGTTTVMHNQSALPAERVRPEAEATLRAFQEVGVRAAFSLAYRDQCFVVYGDDEAFLASLPEGLAREVRAIMDVTRMSLEDYLSLCDELAQRYPSSSDSRVRILLSPQNYHWAEEASLRRIAEYGRGHGLGIHTHLVETLYQRVYAERLHGQTPARRLYEMGFLGPGVSLAHGVWLTEEDLGLLAETGTGVCHNPSSNLRLQSGIAPVLAMLRRGVVVALGTDSTGLNDDDDLFQEMGLALRLHRPPGLEEETITAHQVVHMATLGGARVTGFGNLVGSLEPGKRADLVLMDWEAVTAPYADKEVDPVAVLVARGRGRHVRLVMIDGRVVYRDGVYPGVDAEGIQREIARQLQGAVPAAVQDRRRVAGELEPHLRRYYAGWGLAAEPLYRYHSLR